ncbi:23S rRNA (adenine(2030)-N(6))-methyltransferase RlmJ [Polynucleobacter victoriensis]|uniref:Ribosomal RNA large subunit methyltransferase J n=1 Tax=Polynucleobacter victoriensis TaxID=2049319 RepID=A0A212T6D6_9BURK|nr:23S rRNA (adenine(2030)-N(6))-methyltransferase RlmJ [Polynucleobacter victoriensis]SNC61598.1 23S rRNA (adenine2030-N6)-methyltransferase [Polynucleobacter victoriensis]
MLAYRHAFHAGNHADVLKHCVLQQILMYMNQKDKPYWVIDTHAGAGMYSLASDYANTKSEYLDGVARLWDCDDLPPVLREYMNLIQLCNNKGDWSLYPGSPEVIRRTIRTDDRMRLFELHPTDFDILQENFERDRQAKLFKSDGFASLKALLPPPTRRAVIFMDPPYEIKTDYPKVVDALQEGLARFAEGVYVVWYPILTRGDHIRMLESLRKLSEKTLNIAMTVQEPDEKGFGMLGSGLFIINPPWTLKDTMQEIMPYLVEKLAQYPGASYEIS